MSVSHNKCSISNSKWKDLTTAHHPAGWPIFRHCVKFPEISPECSQHSYLCGITNVMHILLSVHS